MTQSSPSLSLKYSEDLPASVVGILQAAGEKLFGLPLAPSAVPIAQVGIQSKLAAVSPHIALFAVSEDLRKHVHPDLLPHEKLVFYQSMPGLQGYFAKRGVDLDLSLDSPSDHPLIQILSDRIKELEGQLLDLQLSSPSPSSPSPTPSSTLSPAPSSTTSLLQENVKLKAEIDSLVALAKSAGGAITEKSVRELSQAPLVRIHQSYSHPSSVVQSLTSPPQGISAFFPGSDGSGKLTYREVYSRFISAIKEGSRVLVLDVNPESCVDYVFQTPVSSCAGFLGNPASSFKPYFATPPTLPDTSGIISIGAGYFNDAFLLRVDWVSVIQALSSSFDKIFLVGGTISHLSSRYLCNLFSGDANIVSGGSLLQLRAVLSNLRGITSESPKVFVKDPNLSESSLYKKLCDSYTVGVL